MYICDLNPFIRRKVILVFIGVPQESLNGTFQSLFAYFDSINHDNSFMKNGTI